MRILVVEDEKKLAAMLRSGLREQGWAVEVCHDGNSGYELAAQEAFDAIVLDIMLPGRDGLSILRKLRSAGNSVPVILLTARADVTERIEGLELGADDYIAKPFSMLELAARLRAVWRGRSGLGVSILNYRDLTLDLPTRTARRGGQTIELTNREFSLLETLLRNPNKILSRTMLCQQVWGYQFDPGTNVVDVTIQRVRAKIDTGFSPRLIQTIRGVGYLLGEER